LSAMRLGVRLPSVFRRRRSFYFGLRAGVAVHRKMMLV
jgi:hypothetical protein